MYRKLAFVVALALATGTTMASAQPIPPPPVPPYRCNVVPPYVWYFGIRGAAIFMENYRRSCNQTYQMRLQQWQAEMARIQMLNQQRGRGY